MKLPTFKFEKELWAKGYKYICGIDEVGRGAWAGPLVAAAVVFSSEVLKEAFFKKKSFSPTIRDSKQLSPAQRRRLDPIIHKSCLACAVAETDVDAINREGIVKATQRAFRKCLRELKPSADFILIDAFYVKNLPKKNQKPITKGDQKSVSIAAASIIAKVYRDNLMKKLHLTDPRYRFDQHKGYGTKLHQKLIRKHGLSPHHRATFIPEALLRQAASGDRLRLTQKYKKGMLKHAKIVQS